MSEGQRTRRTSTGKCAFCGQTLSKAGMSRHLESCRQSHAGTEPAPGARRRTNGKSFHLVVAGRYASDYWLHLQVPAQATLSDLDEFLRDTWLECCGHLSAFTIEGLTYGSRGAEEVSDRRMGATLGKVLWPGLQFSHEYDFGTTTNLTLKVVSEWDSPGSGREIKVVARNDPPAIACDVCGKPASLVCGSCIFEGDGWLCDNCAPNHGCGEDMLLPVVNSPRVGMCGYDGGVWSSS